MRKYLLILLLLTSFVFTSIAYLKANIVNPNIENVPSHLTLGTISTANSVTLSTSDSSIATAVPQLPSMLRSSNGTLLVFWLSSGNIYSQMSSDNGNSFTKLDGTAGITTIQTIDTSVNEASVSIDSSDKIYVTYLYGISLRYATLVYSSGHWTTGTDNLVGGLRLKGGVSLYSGTNIFWSASMISSGKYQILANGSISYLSNAITDQYSPYPTLHLLGNNPISIYMGIVPSRSIRFVKYNGSSWSTEANIVNISGSSNQFSTAKDSSNNIHLVYVDNGIKYKKYNGSNWTSADATLSSDANDVDPKVSIDSDGNPIVIWSKYNSATDNDLVYKRFNGTTWDTNSKDLVNNGLLNRHISTPESMNSSTLKYIWTEGTGSPYNVKFNSTYLQSYKAHITSSTYTVSGTDITNVPFNTSKATFLSHLTKEDSNITFDDSKISDPVVTGDSIISTAEDGTTSLTYNITVNVNPDISLVDQDKTYLTESLIKGNNTDLNSVTGPLTNPLPSLGPNGSSITWSSSKPNILSNDGTTVNRPLYSGNNETVTFTATITKGLVTVTKDFTIIVIKLTNPDIDFVALDKAYLTESLIKGENPDLNSVTKSLTNPLPSLGPNGSSITWVSNKPNVLASDGTTVNRPIYTSTDEVVTLTATIKKGDEGTTKEFGITILKLPNVDLSSHNYTIDTSLKVIDQIPLGTSKNDFISAIVKADPTIVIDDSNVSDPVKSGDTITIKDQYGNILGVYDISVLGVTSDSSSASTSSASRTTSSSQSSLPSSITSSSTSSITEIVIPNNIKTTSTSLDDSTTQRNRIIVAVIYFLSLLVLVSIWAYRKARRSE